ncbi:MAG: saccharopine dehydrogenase NADP-binding domain-containing protein [Thiohalocapsa sp.]
MHQRLLIYGATGFTGRLVARRARTLGIDAVLAGRDAHRLRPLAESLGMPWRVAALTQPSSIDTALSDVGVVLHVAGPYAATARPMVDACLRTKTHYLDLSGELPVYLDVHRSDAEARSREIMLMPGVGFVVAASDCLAAHVANRMPEAKYLRIAVSRTDLYSRGTLRAMLGLVREGVSVCRNGRLSSVRVGRLERNFDFGNGDSLSTALSWPDVFTAYQTTGIPNIEVYAEANALARVLYQAGAWFALPMRLPLTGRVLQWQTKLWPAAPSDAERAAASRVIVAEAEDPWRQCAQSRLRTPDGYSVTPGIALTITTRLLSGEFRAGFQTPASVYGPDLVLGLDGILRDDVDPGPRRRMHQRLEQTGGDGEVDDERWSGCGPKP